MSFVRLDTGEFPPLDKLTQQHGKSPVKNSQSSTKKTGTRDIDSVFGVPSKNHALENGKSEQIVDSIAFVRCRAGLRLNEYHEDLEHVLKTNYIGLRGDFILAPLEPSRYWEAQDKFEALTDLLLPCEIWNSRIAIGLGYRSNDPINIGAATHFKRIFEHALYLSAPVIVISFPDIDLAYISIASTVNNKLKELRKHPLILFKIPAMKSSVQVSPQIYNPVNLSFTCPTIESDTVDSDTTSSSDLSSSVYEQSMNRTSNFDIDLTNGGWSTSESGLEAGSSSQESGKITNECPWNRWNSLRSHLYPDHRIGVCLIIDDDFTDDDEELCRWLGEPVRMIIIHADQFTRSPGPSNSLQLNARCKDFIKKIAISNSLKTSFVITGRPKQDITEHLQYIDYYATKIKNENNEPLMNWNDKIQPPLQPLSSNLDSSTYGVFEMDSMKYIKYREAMILAIKHLISAEPNMDRKFIVMVLGAGRGPLVDSFIKAIQSVNSTFKFKIYALDKNPSSVLSLKHKQTKDWVDSTGFYETEVVEADMRCWDPAVKADIIATELLGSLSDNELSPECIDGCWKFATPKTISIPQDYASFIAPISSYKLHQELHKLKGLEPSPFDQIYVVRLANYFQICSPVQLFKFEHKDLSLNPSERNNERYTRLVFWSKVDTVCHGFSGYFKANLFGKANLSTLPDQKTPNMDSWFPAFIPLEQPIQMPKDSPIEIHFWRKETVANVYYEWAVTKPVRSRIHTQYGLNSMMSKSI